MLWVRSRALSRVQEAAHQVKLVEQRGVGGQQVVLGLRAHLTEMPDESVIFIDLAT